jgi:nucleotide-binding universal stress UspA family protein
MKLLVALDGTEKDSAALSAAAKLAQETRSEVLLLNVVNPWVDLSSDPAPTPQERLRHVSAQRQAYLEECLRQFAGLPAAVRVEPMRHPPGQHAEDVAEVISRVAAEWDADIAVVASKHPSGIVGLLLGRAVERLLRICPCPVLVVRPHEPA